MPIYEYKCKHCDHYFEVMQKISEAKLTKCPECHQNSLEKLVSAGGFQLKGSGWYVTDFKNKEVPKKKEAPKKEDTTTKSTPAE